jgi:hypothetical protein
MQSKWRSALYSYLSAGVLAQIMIDATGGLKTKSPSITIVMTRKGPRKQPQAPLIRRHKHDGRQKRQRYRHMAAN